MLEDDLGFELFDRKTRPIGLTPAGEVFCEEARLTLEQARRAVERGREAHRGDRGRLSLATIGWACNTVVPAVIRAFRETFPGINLEVSIKPGEDQVNALRQQRLDLGFAGGGCDDALVVSERIHQEPMTAVVPEGHRLAGRRPVALSDLLGEPLLCISRAVAPGMFDAQMELLRRRGIERAVVQEAPDTQVLLGLVAAGLGVSLQPASTRVLGRQGVVFVPLHEQEAPAVSLFVLRRRDDDRDLPGAFLETARAVVPTLGPVPTYSPAP